MAWETAISGISKCLRAESPRARRMEKSVAERGIATMRGYRLSEDDRLRRAVISRLALPHGATKKTKFAREFWHRLRSLFCRRVGAVGSSREDGLVFARTRRDSDHMAGANLYFEIWGLWSSIPTSKSNSWRPTAVLENTLTCLSLRGMTSFCSSDCGGRGHLGLACAYALRKAGVTPGSRDLAACRRRGAQNSSSFCVETAPHSVLIGQWRNLEGKEMAAVLPVHDPRVRRAQISAWNCALSADQWCSTLSLLTTCGKSPAAAQGGVLEYPGVITERKVPPAGPGVPRQIFCATNVAMDSSLFRRAGVPNAIARNPPLCPR